MAMIIRPEYLFSSVDSYLLIVLLLSALANSLNSTDSFEVTGTVHNDFDEAVVNHRVFIFDDQNRNIADGLTDSEGHFTLIYQKNPTSTQPAANVHNPVEFRLGSSYPNPFNPHTVIPFDAPVNSLVSIGVYNILGQQIMQLQTDISQGSHEIVVNLGGRISQGQLILHVNGKGFSLTEKMTFLSAGIVSGTPGISVRSGGAIHGKISRSIPAPTNMGMYRLVMEETDEYSGIEMEITANINYDTGVIVFSKKGGVHSVTDIDGNTYPVVEIGDQWWMAENLNVSRYSNGDDIPEIVADHEWWKLSETETGARSYYNNNIANADSYGSLYNWYAVDDDRGLCPAGWRVPDDEDWKELEMTLGLPEADAYASGWRGSMQNVGGKLKATGTDNWHLQNMRATNESGFSGLPAGTRNEFGPFDSVGYMASWWSGSETSDNLACYRLLLRNFSDVYRGCHYQKRLGYSVRCLKN